MNTVEIKFAFPGEGMNWAGIIIEPDTPIGTEQPDQIAGTPQYREKMNK